VAIVLGAAAVSALVGTVVVLQAGPHVCAYPALCRLLPDGSCAPHPPCPGSGYSWPWVAAAAAAGSCVAVLALTATRLVCGRGSDL
jgi:hypothetical protein